jgi:hypothetical protein
MEITARDLQEVYTLPAREVAARDVARDIEQAKNIIADLDARSRSTDNDIDIAERSDALSGVAKYSQDLLELELRHSILANTDDFMDFDPRVETELVLSKQRHSADARRWSQIDARFDQMQQASVEMALADPRAPYLANLVEGVEGESLVDKLRSEVDVLNRVEHFRLKYEVGDTTTILGTVPEEPGVARHEYMELSALLVERAAERERRHEREHDIAEDLDFILSL